MSEYYLKANQGANMPDNPASNEILLKIVERHEVIEQQMQAA
jgi:hypothetical protein